MVPVRTMDVKLFWACACTCDCVCVNVRVTDLLSRRCLECLDPSPHLCQVYIPHFHLPSSVSSSVTCLPLIFLCDGRRRWALHVSGWDKYSLACLIRRACSLHSFSTWNHDGTLPWGCGCCQVFSRMFNLKKQCLEVYLCLLGFYMDLQFVVYYADEHDSTEDIL